MNYRELYIDHYGEIPNMWEIHHIDWNHNNNDITNLIAVPKIIHNYIHWNGYVDRQGIEYLVRLLYNESGTIKEGLTIEYIADILKKYKHDSKQ